MGWVNYKEILIWKLTNPLTHYAPDSFYYLLETQVFPLGFFPAVVEGLFSMGIIPPAQESWALRIEFIITKKRHVNSK